MTAFKGNSMILKVGDGASPTEIFTIIGGVQVVSMALDAAVLDASHVASGAWRLGISQGGIKRLTLDVRGVFEDSTTEETIRALAFNGDHRKFQLLFGNGDVVAMNGQVSAYTRTGDQEKPEAVSFILESVGTVIYG